MLDRRDILSIFGAVVCTTLPAMAAEDHSAHMHAAAAGAAPANKKLIDTASDCVKTGQACIAHCLQSFAAGDTSLAACAKSVDQMLSVCATLEKLASVGSPNLPAMAKVALAVCEDCEKECRKHADKHDTCKACADACKACADACRAA
jgi:Cys-rich four helix bundle protein (predicted Tat secretion target)